MAAGHSATYQVRQFELEPVLESGDLPNVDDVFIQEFGSKVRKEQPSAHDLLKMHFTTGIRSKRPENHCKFPAYGGRPASKSASAEAGPDVSLLPERKTKNNDLVDCYDTYKHQRLPYSGVFMPVPYDVNASFCVFPWILVIEFYGKNYLTLGDYLDTFCFRTDAKCPNQQCIRPIREHCRRFASGDAAVSVVLKDLDSPTGPPDEDSYVDMV